MHLLCAQRKENKQCAPRSRWILGDPLVGAELGLQSGNLALRAN